MKRILMFFMVIAALVANYSYVFAAQFAEQLVSFTIDVSNEISISGSSGSLEILVVVDPVDNASKTVTFTITAD
ncbi:hypothetical protein ACFL6H_03340 [Candidatus Latescibacterota bacterium]